MSCLAVTAITPTASFEMTAIEVSEPTSLELLALGGLMTTRRRRG